MPDTQQRGRGLARWLASALPLAGVVAATGVLWLRFNAPPDGGGATAAQFRLLGDFLTYFVPMADHLAARLGAGELPLWYPDGCCGIPLLANFQTAIFYPGNWINLLWPAHRALPALVLFECALGGLFAAWLFRAWGACRAAAAAGGVLFVYACCLPVAGWPPALASVVWVPWILLCAERLLAGWRAGWWLGLVLGFAAQLLAGFPQYALYGALLLAAWLALRLVEERRAGGRRAAAVLMSIGSALVLGAGVAAVQLLPAFELVGQTQRVGRLTPGQVHYLNPFGFQDSAGVLRAALDPSPRIVWLWAGRSGYLGSATLLLLAVGVAASPGAARTWLLLGLAGLTLLLSDGYLGPGRPLYAAFAELPFAGSLRTPERLRVVTFFCVIALAVRGFAALRPGPQRTRLAADAGAAALAVAAGMLATGHGAGAWRVAAAALLVLALLWSAQPRLHGAAAAGLLLLLTLDLALATGESAALRGIPQRSVQQLHTGGTAVPRPVLDAQRHAVGPSRLEPVGFLPYVGSGESAGVRRLSCYEALVPTSWASLHEKLKGKPHRANALFSLDPQHHPTIYDVASVQRALLPRPGGRVELFVNDDALPRAFAMEQHRVADRETALEHVVRGDVDFRRLVLLDRDPGLSPARSGGRLHPAHIAEDRPERVAIEVEAPGPALLVLTDTHYPGWEARVDGEPAEIYLANGLHRAVRVEAGPHRVVFEYRPASFRLGAALSLASLAALSLVAVRELRRRRGSPAAAASR